MEVFVVMVPAKTHGLGLVEQLTVIRTCTVQRGDSRSELFDVMLAGAPERMRGSTVTFFSAEPNALIASPPASTAVSG
ncbi:hypothetical protein SAMN05216276_107824 [Streptosporangium subroseum]|uniref:Uncharacterized protein n=2 Tax=Streptosporangium subroseum TaxID=106412 RepID=A0A239P0R5_9ACTN|nr:hypothetical protein SAMN05216276_107824 [Streptosporangium subroseum]